MLTELLAAYVRIVERESPEMSLHVPSELPVTSPYWSNSVRSSFVAEYTYSVAESLCEPSAEYDCTSFFASPINVLAPCETVSHLLSVFFTKTFPGVNISSLNG